MVKAPLLSVLRVADPVPERDDLDQLAGRNSLHGVVVAAHSYTNWLTLLIPSLLRTVLFVLLLSLGGWAHCDDFCGPGPHRRTSSCHCASPSAAAICVCNPAQDSALVTEPLRECLPVLVPFQLAARVGCFSLPLAQVSVTDISEPDLAE